MGGNERNTRRALLTGGAAVVGSAAGAVLLGATAAEAANGNALLAGRANTATASTTLTNSSTSGGAHGLLISTKGGYGFQAMSASNHGLAGITSGASKAGVLATHNGPAGTGAALVANGRKNVGASIYNNLTNAPALVVKAHQDIADPLQATAIHAVADSLNAVAVNAYSEGGTAVNGSAFSDRHRAAVTGGAFRADQNEPLFAAYGLTSYASQVDEDGSGPVLGTALLATGHVDVNGTLTKSSGTFRIDHPLDPANKYLSHSFVESPDMKNVYDGRVVADGSGQATVEMPDWFEELNKDLRYQLTAMGGPAPDLHVKKELANGRFTIGGAKPKQELCWQVTGTRKDAWANAHRVEVETEKPKKERGTYLFPKGFGQPETKLLGYQEPPKVDDGMNR